MSDTDVELLARYSREKAEDAFAEIVRRHVNLVYSAALRQVRSPQLAEEVAQSAFLELAHHAGRLAQDTIVSAWLYKVAHHTALNVVRREARRHVREQIASEMNAINATTADWTHIEPLLDEAMLGLNEIDRAAVLLRYFENKSLREVGQTLGTSDDTAQKRVSRAVERLREFFAKRGVNFAATGLVIVISANAVQAAPVSLSAAIIAGTLAGTAIPTTATATATKAIAMTTLQKTLIASTLVAAIGTGTYEAHRASTFRTRVETMRQKEEQFAQQIEQLTRERDTASNQLAGFRNVAPGPDRNTAELLRLRAELARLKTDAQAIGQSNVAVSKDATLFEAAEWKNRVSQLRKYLEQSPAANTPELQFVNEQDWLSAAKGKLNTEADYRRALSTLRDAAASKVAAMLKTALTAYMKASNDQFPSDLNQLQPYFTSPMDEAVLARWEIAPAATIQSLGLGGESVITQKAPVDDVFDTRYGIGPHGSGSTDFLSSDIRAVMNPLRETFRVAHNGQWPENNSDLLPYATTPEQQAAVQKLILRESSR